MTGISAKKNTRPYCPALHHVRTPSLEAIANNPKAKYLLVVGDAINQLGASGEEVTHHLVHRLKFIGVTIVFSGLKRVALTHQTT